MEDLKQAFFVESVDGRKFKMVIRGDLSKLNVSKIRRYLRSYGVPDGQLLVTADGVVLGDDMIGEDFGLHHHSTLYLRESDDVSGVTSVTCKPGATSATPLATQPAPLSSGSRAAMHSLATVPQAWADPTAAPATMTAPDTMSSTYSTLQSEQRGGAHDARYVAQLEAENAQLRAALEKAQRELRQSDRSAGGGTNGADVTSADPLRNAQDNVCALGQRLGVALQLDSNLTCVVGTDADFTILLTYDTATERLYLYSTLLTALPTDHAVRVKLFEILLEGSLLGREVCGGGIGISLQNELVVLSTSLPVRHCHRDALLHVMPNFVETLSRWRDLVGELLA